MVILDLSTRSCASGIAEGLALWCKTGIKCTTLETDRGGHARDVVLALSLAELQSYDGIVAVRLKMLSYLSQLGG